VADCGRSPVGKGAAWFIRAAALAATRCIVEVKRSAHKRPTAKTASKTEGFEFNGCVFENVEHLRTDTAGQCWPMSASFDT
jgi:hypothetical protein